MSLGGSLVEAVREAFVPGGVLSRAADEFNPRPGQTEMAEAVAETIDGGGILVVEAGTGVGKTFSYLVPALLSGERTLISTATKTLQDQLFGRDLPRLVQALGLPISTALLKGRSSYLCLHRLETARQHTPGADRVSVSALASVERWAQTTRTGDLAEITGLDDRSPIIPLVTSTRENCLGAQCPKFRACHVNLARREAMAADVVVINHHLFFADMAIRESGMAELLPTVKVAIFDEAHQLNETGVQFLGVHLSTGQIIDFARDVLAAGLQQARGLADWNSVASALERAGRELRMCAGKSATGTRLRWSGVAPEMVDAAQWRSALSTLHESCGMASQALDTVSEISPDFVRLHERSEELARRAARFVAASPEGSVRWLDVGMQLRVVESPLDIAEAMQSRILRTGIVGENQDADDPSVSTDSSASTTLSNDGRAFIFTSATLGDDPTLRWFTEPTGLSHARILRVSSPFDYATQASIYVPTNLPKPADPNHSLAVAQLAIRSAEVLGGRTMVLTTTLRALRAIGEAMQVHFEDSPDIEVLVQGQWPKRRLMERFRLAGESGQRGCVLIASSSFWEGVDVPGEALQLVVIDKLPFPPPGDPLVEARSNRLESEGRSSFSHYSLPEAAVALKQGAGRLIRRESDSGVLLVADTRLATMGYGRRLLAALPPMNRLKSDQEFFETLQRVSKSHTSKDEAGAESDSITRSSTTDLH